MSALSFFSLLLASCSLGPFRSVSTLEPPLLFVRQLGEYPAPGEPSHFATGLLVALWPDGRILRATSAQTVARRYFEGEVPPADLASFLAFLETSGLEKREEGGVIIPHNAQRQITLRSGGRTVTFLESLPEPRDPILRDLTQRLMALPAGRKRSVRWIEDYPTRWLSDGSAPKER
ncbi:MAG: hypothetical protein WAM82_10905 [Thermoanaerobaculia bacterium]